MLDKVFYLREIGVVTPVSLVRSRAEHISEAQASASQINNLNEMAEQVMQCQQCNLASTRQHVRFGYGNEHAELLLVSSPPNAEEDKQDESYVGETGQLFDAMLMSIGMNRELIYNLHIVQCAPPHHRDPKPEELHACRIWLDKQIDCVKPKVMVVVGRIAAQALLESDDGLDALRQKWHHYRSMPVLVLLHPAYLLRSPKQKQKAWDDLLLLQQKLH